MHFAVPIVGARFYNNLMPDIISYLLSGRLPELPYSSLYESWKARSRVLPRRVKLLPPDESLSAPVWLGCMVYLAWLVSIPDSEPPALLTLPSQLLTYGLSVPWLERRVKRSILIGHA